MSSPLNRAIILVADGVGCGHAPDARAYGDAEADTLGNLSRDQGGLALPALGALGLGATTTIAGVAPVAAPAAAVGVMREASVGKDTITGHWEMTGVITSTPWATFPDGFPPAIVGALEKATGRRYLGNKPASGTVIIEELGAEHMSRGAPILYTSADSVLQIAAHEDVIPLETLYEICTAARAIADQHGIGRVIARPFVGKPGDFKRTYNRKDYAVEPTGPTLLDAAVAASMDVIGIGKIHDIFGGRGLSSSIHTEGNADGLVRTLDVVRGQGDRTPFRRGIVFVNLIDFDMTYGHRNDTAGFARALEEFDAWLPSLRGALGPGDAVFITADHGNDPTMPGTDHTRECVPLLAFGPAVTPADLGTRASFADLGQTIAEGLGLPALATGTSFLATITRAA